MGSLKWNCSVSDSSYAPLNFRLKIPVVFKGKERSTYFYRNLVFLCRSANQAYQMVLSDMNSVTALQVFVLRIYDKKCYPILKFLSTEVGFNTDTKWKITRNESLLPLKNISATAMHGLHTGWEKKYVIFCSDFLFKNCFKPLLLSARHTHKKTLIATLILGTPDYYMMSFVHQFYNSLTLG